MVKSSIKLLIPSLALILLFASNAFAFESVKFAIKEICGHMQGNLGGLLMTVAGIGGITAAAFGNLRASHSLIVTGVGAAAIAAVLSLYFPKAAETCKGQNQPQANQVDGNGAGAANLARFTADTDLAERKTFNDALAIANGQEAELDNQVELQATDDFDPDADELADGF